MIAKVYWNGMELIGLGFTVFLLLFWALVVLIDKLSQLRKNKKR